MKKSHHFPSLIMGLAQLTQAAGKTSEFLNPALTATQTKPKTRPTAEQAPMMQAAAKNRTKSTLYRCAIRGMKGRKAVKWLDDNRVVAAILRNESPLHQMKFMNRSQRQGAALVQAISGKSHA